MKTLTKEYSKRILFWVILFLGMICIVTDLAIYIGLKVLSEKYMTLYQTVKSAELIDFIKEIQPILDIIRIGFVPASAVIFAIGALLLWICLRTSFNRLIRGTDMPENKETKEKKSVSAVDEQEALNRDKRMFLHILSVLQRDGRLLDFFSEDLETFDDDQIGAAVRNIHDNCNKSIHKYLSTTSVLNEPEGEEITIQPGFDPAAVKLTGNVTGEPPFKGVVRHKGWKVDRLDIPSLSGKQTPDILAPAEVEIL